jgi:molybdopterin molybdotransferase
MGTDLLSFDDARTRLLADVRVLAPERVSLATAAGRVLAADLVSPRPMPGFDHSAMDGYALRSSDLAGDGPFHLRVSGESSAGREGPPVERGAACRIFTGAPVPAGADAVVMQEKVRREGDRITLDERPRARQNIRFAGEDLAQGATALTAGTRLGAGSIALAAMLGVPEVLVARRPRVTILCTGDELRLPGEGVGPASIFESNSAAVGALARQAGADVRVAPIARDEPETMLRAVEQALEGTDVLVTVGGVSVGDHDVVRPALERAGVRLDFWRVAIRPGKPLAVGRRDAAHVVGLPGNPSSALVTFAVFGMPLLRALQGDSRPFAPALRARLVASRKRSPDRLELMRAVLRVREGSLVVEAHDNQSSGAATSLAHSDGLALVPPGDAPIAAGETVDFLRWNDA